jgi:hypothetical protein
MVFLPGPGQDVGIIRYGSSAKRLMPANAR